MAPSTMLAQIHLDLSSVQVHTVIVDPRDLSQSLD